MTDRDDDYIDPLEGDDLYDETFFTNDDEPENDDLWDLPDSEDDDDEEELEA